MRFGVSAVALLLLLASAGSAGTPKPPPRRSAIKPRIHRMLIPFGPKLDELAVTAFESTRVLGLSTSRMT